MRTRFSIPHARLIVALLLLPGCQCGQPDETGETGTTTGPATKGTLLQQGVQTCANPEARNTGNFERRQADALESSTGKTWGVGAILGDFIGDGTLQMVLTGENTNQFWVARQGATPADVEFIEEGAQRFQGPAFRFTVGGTAIDYDGDGDLDLFLTRWGAGNLLLENDGTGHFDNATPPAMTAYNFRSQSGSWGDFDGDGDLDLFVGNYGVAPETYNDPDMPPGHPSELYENLGDGTFADISSQLPTEAHEGYTFSSGWYDLDGDLQPELIIANDFGSIRPSAVVHYADGQFTAALEQFGRNEDMGMGVADLNGDEVPDFLFSSWKSSYFMQSHVSDGGTLWIDSTTATGLSADSEVRQQVYGWGADWADLDNDADLDAIVLYGYWSTYDGANDPLVQVDGLWEQIAPGQFEDRAAEPEWRVDDRGYGRGFATGDLNQDGYLDLIKREVGSPSPLYLSRCGDKHWLRVDLEAPSPNTRGIGAKVAVETNGLRQIRWITAGSTGMYGGQPPEAHFGLNDADTIDVLEITWPDGTQSVFNDFPSNQRVTVTLPPAQ